MNKDVFETIEYIIFRVALLVLFTAGVARILRNELKWITRKKK